MIYVNYLSTHLPQHALSVSLINLPNTLPLNVHYIPLQLRWTKLHEDLKRTHQNQNVQCLIINLMIKNAKNCIKRCAAQPRAVVFEIFRLR